MQNHNDTGIPRFSTPKTIWMFPLHYITIKVANFAKYEMKALISSGFLFFSQYFKFASNYMG